MCPIANRKLTACRNELGFGATQPHAFYGARGKFLNGKIPRAHFDYESHPKRTWVDPELKEPRARNYSHNNNRNAHPSAN